MAGMVSVCVWGRARTSCRLIPFPGLNPLSAAALLSRLHAGLRIVASSRFSGSAGAADPAARRSTGALLPEVMGFWTPYFTAAHAIASIQQALRGP